MKQTKLININKKKIWYAQRLVLEIISTIYDVKSTSKKIISYIKALKNKVVFHQIKKVHGLEQEDKEI